jgi:signal transduction histidine kinase
MNRITNGSKFTRSEKQTAGSATPAGFSRKQIISILISAFLLSAPVPVPGKNGTERNYPDSLKGMLERNTGVGKFNLLIEISQANFSFDPVESLEFASMAYQLAIGLEYPEGEADALNLIGNVHAFLGNHSSALEKYKMAYEIALSIEDFKRMGIYLDNTGHLFTSLREYDSSEVYLIKALGVKERYGDKSLITETLNNLGSLYRNTQHYELALEYYVRSLDLIEETGNAGRIAAAHMLVGEMFNLKGQYNKALSHLMQSLYYAKDNPDSTLLALTCYHIAESRLGMGEMKQAMESISMSRELMILLSLEELLPDISNLLYRYHKMSGDHKTALEFLISKGSMKDSIRILNAASQFKHLESIFETEKQNNIIKLLEKDNTVSELQLARQNNYKLLLIVFLTVIVIFKVIIALRFRLIIKTNRLLKQKINELESTNIKLSESSLTLAQLNATKNRFFSIIAHDLKNPFNELLGFSQLITNNFNQLEEEKLREYISLVHQSVINLYKLLENLLKWCTSQTGTMLCMPEKFDMVVLIDSEINFAGTSASKKQIKIFKSLPDELVIESDRTLISSVIRNLLDNAIKFTPRGGMITIFAKRQKNELFAEIQDNGIGIPQGIQEKLFRLDDSVCRKGTDMEEGGGLGLILCKELIEKLKGEIGVESTNNSGSRFWFRLPLDDYPEIV